MCRNKQAQSRQDPPRSPDTEVCVLVVLELAVDLGASKVECASAYIDKKI